MSITLLAYVRNLVDICQELCWHMSGTLLAYVRNLVDICQVFDRGLIDAAAAPQALDGTTILDTIAQSHRYHSRIFLAPPWPEIYVQDEERRHSMDEARAEFERLQRTYPALGYAVSRLPKIRVAQRADFVLDTLASR